DNGSAQCQNVSFSPKTHNHSSTNWRQQRFPTEFFSIMNVGKVNLDRWDFACRNCVPDGYAGVRVGSRIQNNNTEVTSCLLDPAYNLSFDVGLLEFHFCA